MAGEYGSEDLSLPLVRAELFQVFPSAAAAVIEQNCGKRAAALGAPEQRAQRNRTTTVSGPPYASVVASAAVRRRCKA
jgi:hypothetical protein